MMCVDIDEIDHIAQQSPFLGHNRLRLFSIYDADYLTSASGTLREKLAVTLSSAGLGISDFSSIKMLTTPRMLGIGFNPLTLYCCFDPGQNIRAVVAEVHNTYGEANAYVLGDAQRQTSDPHPRFQFAKTLFVSPFNGVEGHYDLLLNRFDQQQIMLRLDLWVKGNALIKTGFAMKCAPLTTGRLIKAVFRHPLTVVMAMPRIAWQALILRYIRKLPPRMKPKMRDSPAKHTEATVSENHDDIQR